MSGPTYNSFMRPILELLSDGAEWPRKALPDAMAERFAITVEERAETVPSGGSRIDQRVGWAAAYLSQAGLLERPRRGVFRITERGRTMLVEHAGPIGAKELMRFEEFQDFKSRGRAAKGPVGAFHTDQENTETPLERIAEAVAEANSAIAAEALERVINGSPTFLERLILSLFAAMGYGGVTGSISHTGQTGDEGVDGVIRQDALGLDVIYVQAKRYARGNGIGRPALQQFVGALHGKQADRGIFVTTSHFTKDALQYAEMVQARLVLIDGAMLRDLMVQYGIGVQTGQTYVIRRVDEDFFDE